MSELQEISIGKPTGFLLGLLALAVAGMAGVALVLAGGGGIGALYAIALGLVLVALLAAALLLIAFLAAPGPVQVFTPFEIVLGDPEHAGTVRIHWQSISGAGPQPGLGGPVLTLTLTPEHTQSLRNRPLLQRLTRGRLARGGAELRLGRLHLGSNAGDCAQIARELHAARQPAHD